MYIRGNAMDNIDINKINDYGVHVLRAYARSLHIHSPTTKKKEELVQAIVDCYTGKSYYDPATVSRKGRPVKIQMNTNGMQVVQPVADAYDKPYDTMSKDDFEPYKLSTYSDFKYNSDSANPTIVEGYIDIVSKGYGILRVSDCAPSSEDVYVDPLIIAKHDLKLGDYIKGYMSYMSNDNISVLQSVVSVNRDMARTCDFDKSKYQPLVGSIQLSSDVAVSHGSRNYMRVGVSQALSYATHIRGCKVAFLDIKAKPEMSISSNENVTYIPMYFNRSEQDIVSCTHLVTARCKRQVELGENMVLFINNFSELIKAFNIAYTKKYDIDTFDYQAINSIQNILFSAKVIDSERSFTIICIDRDTVNSKLDTVILLFKNSNLT